jgi:hypothetical protein
MLAGAVAGLILLGACSTDSPTAPQQVPAPPPPGGEDLWNITLTIEPDSLPLSSDQPATVSVLVRSKANNQSPPNGTTIVLSTSLGLFGTTGGSLSSVVLELFQGRANVLLFAGSIIGQALVTAQLDGSVETGTLDIVGEEEVFIASILPLTGTAAGGTVVTITGSGFSDPLRVLFGTAIGNVTSVSDTRIRVVTPPAADVCGGPADVEVELLSGEKDTVSGGFTYTPTNDCTAEAT